MDLGLGGKVALVTGSYRGTGAGIAEALGREGARVVVHGFEAGQADAVSDDLRAKGCDVSSVTGDITTDAGADAVAGALLDEFGGVDVLVNNYGVAEGGRWLDTGIDEWLAIYQKNVLSGVRLTKAFIPAMRERGWGRIIWIGTVGAIRPGNRMPHYYASKAVLPNLCVGLAKELSGSGITVNLVSPGIIATKEVVAMMRARAAKKGWGDDWATIEQKVSQEFFVNPTGRLARIDEVGSLVAFVASEQAGYLNAANLRIDGGAADCAV